MSRTLLVLTLLLVWVNARPELTKHFNEWMLQHGKSYSGSEYIRRLGVFNDNLEKIDQLNDGAKYTKFGVNKFTDLSPQEFDTFYKMPKVPAAQVATSCLANGVSAPQYSADEIAAVPDSWDWRTKNVVTPVKDQGQCGSCWTFSTTGNIEGQWAMKGHPLTAFSEQLLVDCSHGCSNEPPYGDVCNQGCNGGWQWNAFFDVMAWGGLETEQEYPYTAEGGTCRKDNTKLMAPITNYTCISAGKTADETVMQAYLYQNGPISVALNAGMLQYYLGGVLDPWFPGFECDPTQLDHALLIVGWGVENNWDGTTTPYWIIKNSWGASWGESGYFRVYRGGNTCGVANAVSSAIM